MCDRMITLRACDRLYRQVRACGAVPAEVIGNSAATGLQLAAICAATAAHESEAMRANRAAATSGIARNTFERDCFAAPGANLAAGMNHLLNWLGKQASAIEAVTPTPTPTPTLTPANS